MAKIKNKKKISADDIQNKKDATKTKKVMNPFEIHVNKEKMKVLGKKQKNDRGLPGVARAKAIEKRKHTLLREYKGMNKSNKFMDKRIGERNKNMTDEDKVMARFTAVRVKTHNKKSIFNLADDVVLTHRGQTLSEIEKFDDPKSDDEDFDEQSGNLDKEFVENAHFGGGMLKKTGSEGFKTHRDLIDQLIAESKKRKAEMQKIKEATLEQTEKLDTEFKELLPFVSYSKKSDEKPVEKPKMDDYDKAMRELKFEPRGTVSDRLKTEDEIAKEEKEKLEKLEKERLERMNGNIEEKKSTTIHRSADDLDDDFVYDSDPEYMLSYNTEGESNVKVDAELNGKYLTKNEDKVEEEGSGNEDEESEEDDEAESESEDDLSDLKAESSESENEEEIVDIKMKKSEEIDNNKLDEEKIRLDLQKRKEIMEKAQKELPYTFSFPNSYEDLQELLIKHPVEHQSVIIERMVKCNHPSLSEGNKANLGVLFAYLLQYLNDVASEICDEKSVANCFEIFKILCPQIYDLAKLNEENAHKSVLEVIKEKHEEYKKKSKHFPGTEVLLFLKLVSILFPTSDFRHQVVTPCFVFIEQMLKKCKISSQRDVSYGLFLCNLILEYTSLSKRYLPAVINYLSGILHSAIPKSGVRLIKVLPPFKSTSSIFVVLNDNSLENVSKMNRTDLLDKEIDENFKIKVLNTTLNLLKEFHNNYKELPSCVEIFDPILRYLKLVPNGKYPKVVRELMENLIYTLEKHKLERKLEYVVMEAAKPKVLRLYEPKIVEIYDNKRYKVQSKEKAERDKMMHKLKKEKKGALREIRRDKSFLGRVKIQQKIRSDQERRDKVKRIYSEASMQQSELNAIDRKKKKK